MAYAQFSASPEALYGTMFMEISKLSPRERHVILDVMLRDENLRRKDEQRVRRMKSELLELRRRGALRPSEDCPVGDARTCNRCRAELGWIVNRGAVCQACRLRVCKACREYSVRTVDWVCTVCYKRSQIQTATGEWMNEFMKKPGQWKDNKFYVSAADIIKSTIRRSWTICDPNTRWPSRDSPDFRPYNSLPRGRGVSDYPSLNIRDHDDSVMKNSPSSDSLLNDTLTNATTVTTKDDTTNLGENYASKQRRVSQFERTLSELYGTRKKSTSEASPSDENVISKTSPSDDSSNTSVANGTEIKKVAELKPSKIPSPRKKVQYTRSETSAICDTPKQQIRKQNSLQPTKKYISKEKSAECPAPVDKRVSFDDENSTGKSSNITQKSGIPKRDLKARNSIKSESKDESNIHNKEPPPSENVVTEENVSKCSLPEVHHAQIDMVSDDAEVEQFSGAVFRKVTIKKRRHDFKKTQAFDDGSLRRKHHCSESTTRDDLLDTETGRILLPDGDDYKLVFISSDSSSKEEDVDDNDSLSSSSATTGHSFTIDDCDWDYFEPSSGVKPVLCWSNRNSPFGSPRVYRRSVLDSPLGSPLVYRRARESDTGTDDDVTRIDSGSPASSDSVAGFLTRMRTPSETEDHLPMDSAGLYVEHQQHLQCVMHRSEDSSGPNITTPHSTNNQIGSPSATPLLRPPPCQNCGSIAATPITQFVPIPVLVPFPVPVPTVWNPLDPVILYNTSDTLDSNLRARLRAIQQRTGAFLWPCVNQASLISSLISPGGDANSLLRVEHSTYTTPTEADVSKAETSTPPATEQNNNVQTDSAALDEHKLGEYQRETETNGTGSDVSNNRRVSVTYHELNANVVHVDVHSNRDTMNTEGESTNTRGENAIDNQCAVVEAAAATEVSNHVSIDGYLVSDNTFMSSSSEYSNSSDMEREDEGVRKPRVRRMYRVNGGNTRESDDALPSSDVTSDCDDDDDTGRMSHSSDRGDDLFSSETIDTDSDDTGTVADKKTKKFSKVFVVNTNDSSSDIEDNTDSSCSSTDSSDNDTDTEMDCVILNYIKPLDDTAELETNKQESEDFEEESVVLLKHVISNEPDEYDNEVKSEQDSLETSDKNKTEQGAEDSTTSGIVLLKHVTFNMFTEDCLDNDCSNNSDSDNMSDNSDSASIDNRDISAEQKTNRTIQNENNTEASAVKGRTESELSNHSTTHPADLSTDQCSLHTIKYDCSETAELSTEQTGHRSDSTPAPLFVRNPELIGDHSSPTTDYVGSVSEESKQTAIDLETWSEPGPSDMKVNDQNTTHATLHDLSSTNAIDIPPPGTVVANEQPNEDSSLFNCLSTNNHIHLRQHRALSLSDIGESAMKGNNNYDETAIVASAAAAAANEYTDNNKSSYVDRCSTEGNDATLFPQEEKFIAAIDKQSEVSTNEPSGSSRSEWNTNAGIRSSDPVRWPSDTDGLGCADRGMQGDKVCSVRGARTGALSTVDNETSRHVPAARYTSLVMITQEPPPTVALPSPSANAYPQVSIVASDTTTIVPTVATDSDVIVRHTNWQDRASDHYALGMDICESNNTSTCSSSGSGSDTSGLAGYFTLALESPVNIGRRAGTPRKPVLVTKTAVNSANDKTVTVVTNSDTLVVADSECNVNGVRDDITAADGVTVVTGGDTLSAVVCLEEGLADDDSWVEDVSHDEDEFATTTATDSSSGEEVLLSSSLDQEEELRGYNRAAIDFTLHTIVEESCEESEVEQSQVNNKTRPTSATDLEKYFFFRLGDGSIPNVNANREETLSETSSIYSEGIDSLGVTEDIMNDGGDPAELASSRLEKYFLSGFTSFTAERRDSDGSVGSDSEGRPSPEQRRKRLVRARGTGRSHSSSLDNLLANAELSGTEPQSADTQQLASEDSSSSETDTYDEHTSNFEKSDGQFDTVKRKKGKKQRGISGGSNSPHDDKKVLETTMEETNENKDSGGDDDGHKTPQPDYLLVSSGDAVTSRKQQSRDSGFIGSCDDLLKDQKTSSDSAAAKESSSIAKSFELKNDLEKITEEKRTTDERIEKPQHNSIPPATSLTRKDSFNNWSSDEETNLMMSKMRQFFKTMVANSSNTHINASSKPTTPVLSKHSPLPIPSPRAKNRNKPPQLVYFENELTRLMKTVPGIRDDQVREIVEYLSSEDTWSDSYDSSDYTSSDLEGTTVAQKSALQEQISASCQQIINKFEKNVEDEEGDRGDGGIMDESQGLNRETTIVYQKLVASLNKMTVDEQNSSTNKQHNPYNSPPLIAKVMHHIGSRLVALMHEVSSGESHCSISPKIRHHHRRLQQKLSSASTTTTEDDDSTSDSNLPDRLTELEESGAPYNLLPRSRSHDLLLGEARAHHQSSSGVSDIAEEREASDYERFSWRGSFESALMATDSRTKLSLLGAEGSASASALVMAAKRRSAGDLLFSPKSLSREQLDRVRSCGSIGGGSNSEEKHWVVTPAVRPNRRRSSVPDATCGSGGSADGEDDDEEDLKGRSTLPRSLQTNTATTNSLPRLPTTATAANMHKAQSMHHFLQHTVKSARYRPPGFNRSNVAVGPKRAVSAPGLQPSHPRRETRRRSQQSHISSDDVSITESNSSPIVGPRSGSKSASPSPIHGNTLTRGSGSVSSADWQNNDDDIDRLVALHQNRSSLSSLGLRSDSMASVYSGAGEGRYGIVAVRGQVEFGLQYNYKAGALEIHVKQCRDLAPVDVKRNRSDPYVKVYLLPDKSKSGKRKTKVKKHTLNPTFDECLKFHLSLSGLETRTLWLTVWHSDMFGRNDFLGEVMMPLENKVFDDPTPKWYNLQERTEPFEELPSYKGDIIIGLKFVPPDMTVQKKGKRSRGALHVLVKEAKNLIAVKANGTSDPFCKSYLLPDKGRSNKQKTPILRRTTSPVWNHSFVYDDVTLQELAERALELTVWDHDRLASNEFLGGVRFSLGTNKHYGKNVDWMDASGKELSLWQSMLERPNFWVEGCVILRSSLDNRST